MLSPWDDYPIHQTAQPIAHAASGDPSHYERYWFGVHDRAATVMAGLTLTLNPNRGTVDAAFSVAAEGRQEMTFATGALAPDRTELVAGPVRIEVIEPFRRMRITVDEVGGLGAELMIDATSPAHEEPRVVRTGGVSTIQDRTRLVQFGAPSGRLRVGDDREVGEGWLAARDHSWGIKMSGSGTAQPPRPSSAWFVWAMLQLPDGFLQAVTHEDADGNPYGVSAAAIPRLGPSRPTYGPDAGIVASTVVACDIDYRQGTRWPDLARLRVGPRGSLDTAVEVSPRTTFLMKGLGYGHPRHQFGAASPDARVIHERWVLSDLDPLATENLHVQQLSTVHRDDGSTGVGILEHCVKGRHAPSGMSQDGAAAPSY